MVHDTPFLERNFHKLPGDKVVQRTCNKLLLVDENIMRIVAGVQLLTKFPLSALFIPSTEAFVRVPTTRQLKLISRPDDTIMD